FSSPTPSPTERERPPGGLPLARSVGRPGPVRAAGPWLGRPRLSAAFPCAVGLRAHEEPHQPPRRGGGGLLRPALATPTGSRPTSPAIVGHADAIWIRTVLPSAAPHEPNGSRWHGRATRPGVPIPAPGSANPRPTDFAIRFPAPQP